MCPHCHADSGLLQQILRNLADLNKPTVHLFFIGFFRDYPATWWAQWDGMVRKLSIDIRPISILTFQPAVFIRMNCEQIILLTFE